MSTLIKAMASAIEGLLPGLETSTIDRSSRRSRILLCARPRARNLRVDGVARRGSSDGVVLFRVDERVDTVVRHARPCSSPSCLALLWMAVAGFS